MKQMKQMKQRSTRELNAEQMSHTESKDKWHKDKSEE